jgi:hypothetical protein
LQKKKAETLRELYTCLAMRWRVKATGGDPDAIDKMGYNPDWDMRKDPGAIGTLWTRESPACFNVAVMKDGSRVRVAPVYRGVESVCEVLGLFAITDTSLAERLVRMWAGRKFSSRHVEHVYFVNRDDVNGIVNNWCVAIDLVPYRAVDVIGEYRMEFSKIHEVK